LWMRTGAGRKPSEPVRELARVRVIESTFDDVGREGLVELARRVGT
jgi:hypothetical protein